MADRVAHDDAADTSLDQPGSECSNAVATLRAIWDAARFIAIHILHDILLLHLPVRYASEYLANMDAVMTDIDAPGEKDPDSESGWKPFYDTLSNWSKPSIAVGMVIFR